MKVRFLAIAMMVGIFSGISHADSCVAGPFSNLLGTSCTIGDKTFTFSANYSGTIEAVDGSIQVIGQINPSSLFFTPMPTSTSSGFSIGLFPGTASIGSQYEVADFSDFFTAVPLSGAITSSVVKLNGISQDGTVSSQDSLAALIDGANSNEYYDEYSSRSGAPTESTFVGGAEPSFGGTFRLYNDSYNGTGSTSFTSADFVFNESTTTAVPEGPEMALLGISAVGILAALKRKSRTGLGT